MSVMHRRNYRKQNVLIIIRTLLKCLSSAEAHIDLNDGAETIRYLMFTDRRRTLQFDLDQPHLRILTRLMRRTPAWQ